jgi:hypothetical protein
MCTEDTRQPAAAFVFCVQFVVGLQVHNYFIDVRRTNSSYSSKESELSYQKVLRSIHQSPHDLEVDNYLFQTILNRLLN